MNTDGLQKLPAALFEIGKLIGSNLDPGILLSRIAELICQLIDTKVCSVMLLDADRKRMLAKAAYGLRTERMAQNVEDQICGEAILASPGGDAQATGNKIGADFS